MDDKDLLIEKMETKICQLTRVVFHLNNKYLDSQATIESIALSYDKEIENIVRESNLTIKKLKNKVNELQDNNKFEEKLKQLQQKIEEKQNEFINQFNQYKNDTIENEKKWFLIMKKK